MVQFRQGGDRWGSHRVVEGLELPQAALTLDASLPPFENEILVRVRKLQIDSASFHVLSSDDGRPRSEEAIKSEILEIVHERGKMQNPVTQSGGVFLGEVEAVGDRHPLKENLSCGDQIVSLVSLTLTPLKLDHINSIDLSKHQVIVEGSAIIFASGLAQKLPGDFSEGVVLAALDICGAPAQIKRLVCQGDKVLIIGLGRAGRAMATIASEHGALVLGVDPNEEPVNWCQKHLKGHYDQLDATNAVGLHQWVHERTKGSLADISVNASSGEGCEMGSILSCRDGGRVLFFSMATSFQKATLGAEGVGKDVMMMFGTGYVPGHADLMLNLLRTHKPLRKWFEKQYG